MMKFLKSGPDNRSMGKRELIAQNEKLRIELTENALKLDLYGKAFASLSQAVETTSKGDLSARVISWDQFEELSEPLSNFNQTLDLADAFVRESSAVLQAALNKEYHRKFLTEGILGDFGRSANVINDASEGIKQQELNKKSQMDQLTGDFQQQVFSVIEKLSGEMTQSNNYAQQLIEQAQSNKQQAEDVSNSAEQTNINVQTVASASEQLSASIQEITRQVTTSFANTQSVADQTGETANTIEKLDQAASTIDEVVKLINDIAGQTNLLALNATIEAARAGEAGRGFSVVASEVKALAQQTANATQEIDQQVTDIQSKTQSSVISVKDIRSGIGKLSEISQAISAAAEEQSSATEEISRNINQASQSTSIVSDSMLNVRKSAEETLISANNLLSSSSNISIQINHLKEQSEHFISTLKVS
jgi:methyl-accepting chemotaxis protein